MKRVTLYILLALILGIALTACGGGSGDAEDYLALIKERGTLIVSSDPNYAPQSMLDPEGVRKEDTKCEDDQLTYGELVGFDVDVAVKIGEALGVETCFATPDWAVITAGTWGGHWDISVGSMTVTKDRQKALWFSTPYYYTPAQFAAKAGSVIETLEDINGQVVCLAISTTYETWIEGGDLGLPEENFYFDIPTDVTTFPLESDQECPQAIDAGREEFFIYLTSGTVVDANIAAGMDVVKVGLPVFSENLAVAIDKSHELDTASLLEELNTIIQGFHDDGILSDLSMFWFEVDLTLDPTK